MKRTMAALLLALSLCAGLTACGNYNANPADEPLFTNDVPGVNTLPGAGVPTASPAAPVESAVPSESPLESILPSGSPLESPLASILPSANVTEPAVSPSNTR